MKSIFSIAGNIPIISFQENLLNDRNEIKAYRTDFISSLQKNVKTMKHKGKLPGGSNFNLLSEINNRKKCCRGPLKDLLK